MHFLEKDKLHTGSVIKTGWFIQLSQIFKLLNIWSKICSCVLKWAITFFSKGDFLFIFPCSYSKILFPTIKGEKFPSFNFGFAKTFLQQIFGSLHIDHPARHSYEPLSIIIPISSWLGVGEGK